MRRLDAGFSLMELLVCFSISMLLIGILIQHLLSVSRQYQQLHSVLEETIELQWVFDTIRARIRHAGFTPCRGLNQLHAIDTRDRSETLKSMAAIAVQEGEEPRLLIQKMDETAFGLAEILTPNQVRIHHHLFKSNQPVLISDCTHAEVHDIKKIGDIIQLNQPLVFHYSPEVYIGPWISEAFFFRKSKGLFIKQQRVDYMAPAKKIEFTLDHSTVSMRLHSKLGKIYVFKERIRM
jgi:hypothetical protein